MATAEVITNANYGKEEEQYTGFVFGLMGIEEHDLAETADEILGDDNKLQDYLYKIIQLCEKKLKSCKYKVKLRINYGYTVDVKVELPKPLFVHRTEFSTLESLRDEMIAYFRDEYKVALYLHEGRGWYMKYSSGDWGIY